MIIAPSRPTRTPAGPRVVLLVLAVLAGVFAMHALPQVPVRAHAHPATAAATAHAPVATAGDGAGRTFGAVLTCGHGADGMEPEADRAAAPRGHAGTGHHAGTVPAATHGEAAHAAAGVPGRAVRAPGPSVGVVPAVTSYEKAARAAAGGPGHAVPAPRPSAGGVSGLAAYGDPVDTRAAALPSRHAVPAAPGGRAAQADAPGGQRADDPRKGGACARAGHGHGGGHLAHADATCAAAGTSHAPTLPALAPVRFASTGAGPGGGPLDGACADRGGRAPPSLGELQLLRI